MSEFDKTFKALLSEGTDKYYNPRKEIIALVQKDFSPLTGVLVGKDFDFDSYLDQDKEYDGQETILFPEEGLIICSGGMLNQVYRVIDRVNALKGNK